MGVTNYMTVNGKIRSEHRADEAHSSDFVHDASGNVVGVYQNGWLQADASYEPYGGIYTQWNMESGGYRFTWMGGWGYRQTLAEWSSVYVRARHYARSIGSWLSVDPLWPDEMAYGYVEGRVMTGVDYWGRQVFNDLIGPISQLGGPIWFDARKLIPKNKEPDCFVRVCYIYGFAGSDPIFGSIATHAWVCGKTPRKWCFGGLPGNNGYEAMYGCKSKTYQGMPIKCVDVTTECATAVAACNCIREDLRKKPPTYDLPLHVCYDFHEDVSKCACNKIADRKARLNCQAAFRSFGATASSWLSWGSGPRGIR